MYSFGYAIIFMMQILFSRNVMNTKVVANFHVFLVLEFHDHRPDSFGVMLPAISLSDLHALYANLNDCVVWLS
jgi:hypothetical protein